MFHLLAGSRDNDSSDVRAGVPVPYPSGWGFDVPSGRRSFDETGKTWNCER